jgi:HAD domain in Swiss Army Knife RNA repair proteins
LTGVGNSRTNLAVVRAAALGYGPAMDAATPLVLLDVDGVLNPAGSHAVGYRRQWVFPNGIAHRLLLNPGHGPMLLEMAEATGAELVWASYWRGRANTWIAPRIGLPSLRFVPIPTRARLWSRPSPGPWKALHAAAWVGQTPFVWLEDDVNVAHCLAQAPGLGRHLVVRIDPAVGLTAQHVAQARAWLDDLDR